MVGNDDDDDHGNVDDECSQSKIVMGDVVWFLPTLG